MIEWLTGTSAPNWLAVISAIIALAAGVMSFIAVGHSRNSAEAAQRSAVAAEAAAQLDRDRRHDERTPRLVITFGQVQDVGPDRDRASVYADVENCDDRAYKIRPTALLRGRRQITVDPERVAAKSTARVNIMDGEMKGMTLPKQLELAVDPDGWECGCGRVGDVGHWLVLSDEVEEIPFKPN